MESDRIAFGVATFVLLLGACSSDENDSVTGGAGGFSETGGNTLLAGQGDQINGARPTATSDPSSDKYDSTPEAVGGFSETGGNTLLSGQGGQTNDVFPPATSGQDAALDSSFNTATGDAAETVDSGVVDSGVVDSGVVDSGVVDSGVVDSGVLDDIVVEDGQVLLARPTGQYRVGVSERVMTPGAGPVGNAVGSVALFTPYFTRIFYPIDPAYAGERFKISSALASQFCTTPDRVLTHSYPNANMVPGTDRFPVVLFAPQSGAPINFYISILEDLASHGYVVVAFQPTEGTLDMSSFDLPLQPAPCGTKEEWTAYYEAVIEAQTLISPETSAFVASWVADAVYTLDQIEQLDQQDPADILTGRLDLEKVGMFGHSIGSAAAREACMTDPRFKACGALDGFSIGEHSNSPMTRPLMIQTTSDHNNGKEFLYKFGYIDIGKTNVETVWDMTKDASAYRIVIRDIVHQSFADSSILLQYFIWGDAPAGNAACVLLETMATLSMLCATKEDYVRFMFGTLDLVRAINISKAYTRAFFDKHLKGIDPDLLKGPSAAYPEVTFEVKNP